MTTFSEVLQLAVQHHQSNRLVQAEQLYRKLLEQQPTQPDALHGLCMLVQQKGEYKQAESLLALILRVQPQSIKAWFSLGNLRQVQGQLPEAIQAYQKTLALNPKLGAVYNNLGYTLQLQEKWSEAIACYKKALELQPNFTEANVNLANALHTQGELPPEKHSHYAGLNNDLGIACQKRSDFKTAVAYYRQAIALQPDLANAHCNLGLALQEQGNFEEGIACCQQSIELNPNYGKAYMHLGRIYQRQNKLKEAASAYRQGLNLTYATGLETDNGSDFLSIRSMLASKEELYLKPILITGAHRSGSTWAGKMLASSSIVHYIHEPFNLDFHPDAPLKQQFQHVTVEDGKMYEDYIRRILYPSQIDSSMIRPLMKDPLALLSAEWLHRRFDMQVMVIIRHPSAFTASCKRMNWEFGFEHIVAQPRLLDGLLKDFKDNIIQFAKVKYDLIDQCILAWRFLHAVILKYREWHPDWLFVRHEDLSISPLVAFAPIFEYLKLPYTQNQQEFIQSYCNENNPTEAEAGKVHQLKRNSSANIGSWKKLLTEDEQTRIRQGTIDIAQHFYGPEDW